MFALIASKLGDTMLKYLKNIISVILLSYLPGQAISATESLVLNMPNVTYTERALVFELFNNLKEQQTMQGRFFQTHQGGKDGLGANGVFYFSHPKQFLFDYDPPNEISIVSNGRQVLIKDEKRKSNKYYPISQTPMKFLSFDPNSEKAKKALTDVRISGGIVFVEILQNSLAGQRYVTLEFNREDKKLIGWSTKERSGLVHVELFNITYGKPINSDLFYVEPRKIDH